VIRAFSVPRVARSHAVAVLGFAVAILTALAGPGGVEAHALLAKSEPAPGATLGRSPGSVLLRFTERPDLRLTSIRVLDSSGTDHATGEVFEGDPAGTNAAGILTNDLPDGVYTVSWRTVSAVDGHISAGSFAFGVGVAPPSGPPDEGAGGVGQVGSPPAIGARWILYLGLMALIGAAFAAVVVARRPAPDLLVLAAIGWVLSAVGTVGVVGVQWAETGAPLESLPATSVGAAALARAATLGLVALSLAALATVPALAGVRGWLLVGGAAGLALVADVATGHAAAGDGWLGQVVVQSVHGIAAGAWLGGLAGLLVLLRTTPAGERLPTAKRFSNWAAVALATVAATGVVRAVQEIGTFDALVGTDFGRVAIAKSGFLLAIAGLGAINRFVNLRDAARVLGGLRRFGTGELALAVGVLGLSALLVNLTPPTSTGAPPEAPSPIVALGSDFGTSVKLRLIGSPGFAGENALDATVVDFDTEEPVDASALELRVELVSTPGVEPSTLDLDRTGVGRFAAQSASFAIDGIYRVTATVTLPGGAVEVPLLVVTTIAEQPVETIVTPDLPTIYNVALGHHGFAQVYLDPGRAGQNELHVTFFDAAGGAFPIPAATFATSDGRGGSMLPTTRQLDVGHFVATVDVGSGDLAVDIVGPLPETAGPGQVHVHVTIEVQP
jgi:copper transport protein